MGEAIGALKVLLTATEPEKAIIPEVKRSQSIDKTKGGISPELRLMRLANMAVENTLRKMKERKSNQKIEIRLFRIASKVVDAAINKTKAKR